MVNFNFVLFVQSLEPLLFKILLIVVYHKPVDIFVALGLFLQYFSNGAGHCVALFQSATLALTEDLFVYPRILAYGEDSGLEPYRAH